MKLFKKISAMFIATAMFGMSAMAAGVITLDKEVTVASDATQVSFEIKVDEGTTIGEYASLVVTFDNEVFTPNESLTTCGYGYIQEFIQADGKAIWQVDDNTTVTADEDTLVSFVFDVNAGKDPNGKQFSILTGDDDWNMPVDEDWAEYIALPANTTIKVVVEESDPQPVTAIDSKGNTRYVAVGTLPNVETTATSVLKATYKNETKEGNLWELLKVEEGATGTIEIKTLTVKMVLPVGSVQPTADDFSFAVEAE